MNKIKVVLVLLFYLVIYIEGYLFAEMNDLDRSFKDLERTIKQDSLKDLQTPKDYAPPEQPIQPLLQDITPPPSQKIPSFTEGVPPKDIPATDKAILKNQERLQKMMDEQRQKMSQKLEDWGLKIPEKYRFIVDLFVIAICVTLFGLIFYRRRVKKEDQDKVADEAEGPDDGITFYDLDNSKDKFR